MTELKTCVQVSDLVCEVAPGAKPCDNAAPVEFLILESRDSFPEGRAAAAAIRLVGRGLVEAKANVTVLLPKAGGSAAGTVNLPHTGLYKGIQFEFTCGTATRSPHFFNRRRDAVKGYVILWLRIIQKRMACGRKGLCVCLYGAAPFLCLPVLLLAKLLRFLVIVELCEWKPAFTSATHLTRNGTPNESVHLIERVWSNWYHRLRVWLADGVLAISEDLERKAAAILPAPRKRNVLRHSILVDVNEAPVERLQPDTIKGPYVLWCGEVGGYFDSVIWLLRCYAVALKRVEGLKFMLVGPLSNALKQKLLGEIAAAGLTEKQVIVGGYVSRRELWTLYSGAVALLAPLDDSERSRARFPWKIAEYLASGRPVITSDVGEIPRYFTDGENALVARPDDEEDFVSKIELVAINPALADRIGAAGRELALRKFHYSSYGETLLRFVRSLTDRDQSNLVPERSDLKIAKSRPDPKHTP
jgi:glycosyltransferase involved in cell wall biosynthesis